MTDMERRIIAAVDEQKDDLIAFFRELLQCRSFTGKEQEVAAKLIGGLRARGMAEVELVERTPGRPNVLAYYRGAEEGPTCTFNGHLDVLPPQDYASWDHPPFAADMEDGRIYGRGTVDMKTGTFSSFFAGLILQQLKVPIRGQVLFTGVCDELVCGNDGILYLIEKGYIKKEHPEDFGINCEPTDLRELEMATKGVLRADILVKGKGAFNARPYLGISAIDKAVKFIEAVQQLHQEISTDPAFTHPLLAPRTVQVAMIQGGEASNLVPEQVKMTVTRRMHPGETEEGCLADYQRIIDRLHAEDPEFVAEIHPWPGFRPPVEVSMDIPLVDAVRKALKLASGTNLQLTGSEGGTDASHVVARTGIPMPVFGPGDHNLLGTNQEHVKVEDFLNAIKTYALTVYYMMGIEA